MRIVCRGGPFDERRWDYPSPLPHSVMLLDRDTWEYHEYLKVGHTNIYTYNGPVGYLAVAVDLDAERSSM